MPRFGTVVLLQSTVTSRYKSTQHHAYTDHDARYISGSIDARFSP